MAFLTSGLSLGSYGDARGLQEKVLGTCRDTLGDEHADTLNAMYNLAAIYWEMYNFEEALALKTARLEISRRLFGEESDEVLSAIENLAQTLTLLDRTDDASVLNDEAMAIRNRQGRTPLLDPPIQRLMH